MKSCRFNSTTNFFFFLSHLESVLLHLSSQAVTVTLHQTPFTKTAVLFSKTWEKFYFWFAVRWYQPVHRQNSQTNLVMVIVVSAWLIVLQSSSVVNESQHEPQGKMPFSSPPHTTVESLECLWFTNTNIPSIQDARRPFLFLYPFFFFFIVTN